MAETTYFPRRLILAGAMIAGVLLALAVHMLGARYGLDLGGLWRSDTREFMPAGAAIAWWLIATVGFCGGYFTATLMDSAVSGQIPPRMRQFLIAVGVLVLAGAGQAASAPSPLPTISGVLAGPRGAVPRRRDGILRRAFCAAEGVSRTSAGWARREAARWRTERNSQGQSLEQRLRRSNPACLGAPREAGLLRRACHRRAFARPVGSQ